MRVCCSICIVLSQQKCLRRAFCNDRICIYIPIPQRARPCGCVVQGHGGGGAACPVEGGGGAQAHGNTERQVVDGLRTEVCGQQQSNNPHNNQHSPNTPTTGLHERGNDTSRCTGRSSRQKAATRRNMRREERVTVQGPVKKQQPDGMSHRGGGGGQWGEGAWPCRCVWASHATAPALRRPAPMLRRPLLVPPRIPLRPSPRAYSQGPWPTMRPPPRPFGLASPSTSRTAPSSPPPGRPFKAFGTRPPPHLAHLPGLAPLPRPLPIPLPRVSAFGLGSRMGQGPRGAPAQRTAPARAPPPSSAHRATQKRQYGLVLCRT